MARKEVAQFLENYRRLEAAAAAFLRADARSGIIPRLIRHPKMEPYRDELDCCREVRNLLTHEVSIEGEPAVLPGAGMNAFLLKIIELLENPPRVEGRMTPRDRLYIVRGDSCLLPALLEMEKRNLSRVPILDGERVTGMLSTEAVFRLLLDRFPLSEETRVRHVDSYFSLDAAPTVAYRFVPPETLLEDAEKLFSHAYGRNCKIRAILVTPAGSPTGNLLGVLSPYDVMEK